MKKILKIYLILSSLFLLLFAGENVNYYNNYHEDSGHFFIDGKFIWEKYNFINLKHFSELSISNACIETIVKYEGLKLEAYSLGDGMITIGYGHAEPEGVSYYKIGDKISEEEAKDLFRNDLNKKQYLLKQIFYSWEKESGRKIYLTQNMMDAIISITYNIGIGGFINSEIAKNIKRGNYIEASESFRITKISDKYPLLRVRRAEESELFISDYINY